MLALQLGKTAPTALLDVLSAEDQFSDSSWLETLRRDLRWFAFENPADCLHGSSLSAEEIFNWIAHAPSNEASLVRRTVMRVLTQEKLVHDVRGSYQRLLAQCELSGAVLSRPVEPEPDVLPSEHPCPHCDRVFGSIQALSFPATNGGPIRLSVKKGNTSPLPLVVHVVFIFGRLEDSSSIFIDPAYFQTVVLSCSRPTVIGKLWTHKPLLLHMIFLIICRLSLASPLSPPMVRYSCRLTQFGSAIKLVDFVS